MTSKTRGPVDTEEDSGNPFEGFTGKLHMRSRWVWVEGDLLATGCPLAPWEHQCWLHPMQLSLITSPQKAYCDDAIPLEAQDIPVDYPLIRITFSLSFSWCWLQLEKSMIWLMIFHYRIDTGGGWVIHTQPMTFLIYTTTMKMQTKERDDANALAELPCPLWKLLNGVIPVCQSSFAWNIEHRKTTSTPPKQLILWAKCTFKLFCSTLLEFKKLVVQYECVAFI